MRSLASSTLGGILGTYQLTQLLSERWSMMRMTHHYCHISIIIIQIIFIITIIIIIIIVMVISSRERVADEILRVFKEQCDPWGVTVERVEVFLLFPFLIAISR